VEFQLASNIQTVEQLEIGNGENEAGVKLLTTAEAASVYFHRVQGFKLKLQNTKG